jgi:hypothetical protein
VGEVSPGNHQRSAADVDLNHESTASGRITGELPEVDGG